MKNLLLSCCCALLLLTACSSNDDAPNVPLSKLQITHASPGNSGLDLTMDGLRVNNIPFNYLANSGYLDAYAGQRKFTANPAGGSGVLVEQQLQLTADKRYSMFLYDSGVKIKTLFLEDVFPNTEAGKAHIRFFHLAPDAPAVTIGYVSGGTFTPVFSNRSFETQATGTQNQGFTAVAAATYTIEVRRASDNMVVFSRPGVPLSEGKIYTFYARGLINSVTTPLGAEVIINR
ncbi:DUF4397 domain-containing protein [Chitinophaga lutea]|uniref:DUF4397 domain-containing protein n=1 Tax=Chitinophaga lutea TaxID=2488634 RepID=A0A3N4Q5F0_9BACT|nr:DUF4397 domain-containing protein [Chitinophaga lutea]RPE12741.1 DUF4397 domain-containing protein [Chitinophaga lutea]